MSGATGKNKFLNGNYESRTRVSKNMSEAMKNNHNHPNRVDNFKVRKKTTDAISTPMKAVHPKGIYRTEKKINNSQVRYLF